MGQMWRTNFGMFFSFGKSLTHCPEYINKSLDSQRNESQIKLTSCLPPPSPPPPPSAPSPPPPPPSAPRPTLQEFQDEIAPIQDDVTHMNQLASTFGPHDVQLSAANLDRLDDLNTRWKLLQVRTPPPVCCRGGGKKKTLGSSPNVSGMH